MKLMPPARLRSTIAWALVISMLFPPFVVQLGGAGASTSFGCGFGFVFSWPEYNGHTCRVDTGFLLAEWCFIGLLLAVHQWQHIAAMWNERIQRNNRSVDAQQNIARIVAAAIVQHAEEQRIQKTLF